MSKDFLSDDVDQSVDVSETYLLKPLMRLGYEVVDAVLMVDNVRFKIVEVEHLRALSLWKHEVEQKEEPEPRVERNPADDEQSPGLSKQYEGQNREVDQPRMDLSRVMCSESFVREVCWKEDRGDGADRLVNTSSLVHQRTHEIRSAKMPNIMACFGLKREEVTADKVNWRPLPSPYSVPWTEKSRGQVVQMDG